MSEGKCRKRQEDDLLYKASHSMGSVMRSGRRFTVESTITGQWIIRLILDYDRTSNRINYGSHGHFDIIRHNFLAGVWKNPRTKSAILGSRWKLPLNSSKVPHKFQQ